MLSNIDRQLNLWRDVDFTSPRRLNGRMPAIGSFYREHHPAGVPGSSSTRSPSASWLSIGFYLRSIFPVEMNGNFRPPYLRND